MNREEIVIKLREMLFEKLDIDKKAVVIEDTTPLMDYGLGVDSVSTIEFIVALENEFDVIIDESEVDQPVFRTLESVAEFIYDKQQN